MIIPYNFHFFKFLALYFKFTKRLLEDVRIDDWSKLGFVCVDELLNLFVGGHEDRLFVVVLDDDRLVVANDDDVMPVVIADVVAIVVFRHRNNASMTRVAEQGIGHRHGLTVV